MRARDDKDTPPFYRQFDGAKPFRLTFPLDPGEDSLGSGPYWSADGEVLHRDESSFEEIYAVSLVDDRYLLASSYAPFSQLRLSWGDEFVAKQTGEGELEITKVITPQRYIHYGWLIRIASAAEDTAPLVAVAHQLGGGWERIAGGFFTVTVPTDRAAEFASALKAHGWSSHFLFDD